jgi:2-C-methyl-D-erythritol 4-phosphate cytidylyltransferase
MKTRRNLAVIVASGTGKRMESKLPKQFIEISKKPVLALAINCFEKSRIIDEIILVVPEKYLAYTSQAVVDRFGYKKIKKIITGGDTRQESVLAGLKACPRTTGDVAIHDGVRPFVRGSLIDRLFEEVKKTKAVIPAIRAKETVKFVDKEMTCKTLPRESIYLAQTPQVFNYISILDIHEKAAEAEYKATDDAMLAEQYGMKVMVVPGHYDNIKITTPADLVLAEEMLKKW